MSICGRDTISMKCVIWKSLEIGHICTKHINVTYVLQFSLESYEKIMDEHTDEKSCQFWEA